MFNLGRPHLFWCDSLHEVDLVVPAPFDRLLWELCVKMGCCGGAAEGGFLNVADLLPTSGIVSAETFAAMALQAEGDSAIDDDRYPRHMEALKALFVRHMGAPAVPAEALKRNLAQPFEEQDVGSAV